MCYWYPELGYGIFNEIMINEAEMLLLKRNGVVIIVR